MEADAACAFAHRRPQLIRRVGRTKGERRMSHGRAVRLRPPAVRAT